MKKIIFLLILILSTLGKADCSLVSGINADSLASTVISTINDSKLKGEVYCDKSGYYMIYYLKDRNSLQIGLAYKVDSLEETAPTRAFNSDKAKIYDKIKKEFKGKEIEFRMYLQTRNKVYQIGTAYIDKNGRQKNYMNENNKGTIHNGISFGTTFETYTDDIIY